MTVARITSFLRANTRLSAILGGIGADTLSQFISLAVNLFVVSMCISTLGSSYGIWLAGFGLLSLLGILEFGVGQYYVRELSICVSEAKHDELPLLFGSVLISYLILGCLAMLFGQIAVYQVGRLVTNTTPEPELIQALRIGVFSLALGIPLGILRASLQGFLKLAKLGHLTTIECLLNGIFTALGVLHFRSLVVIPLVALLSQFVMALLTFLSCPPEIRRVVTKRPVCSRRRIGEIVSFGRNVTGAKICFAIRDRTDAAILSHYMGGDAVVRYVTTQKLARIPLMILGSITTNLFAPLCQILSADSSAELRGKFVTISLLAINVVVITSTVVFLLNPFFIRLWVGESYFAGHGVSAVFASWIISELFARGFSSILWAKGRVDRIFYTNLAESILNLLLSLILVQSLGLLGVALGTLIGSLLTSCWYVPLAAGTSLGVTSREVISSFSRPGFRVVVISAASTIAIFLWFGLDSSVLYTLPLVVFLIFLGSLLVKDSVRRSLKMIE